MGMVFAPTWLRQVREPPASHDHFNRHTDDTQLPNFAWWSNWLRGKFVHGWSFPWLWPILLWHECRHTICLRSKITLLSFYNVLDISCYLLAVSYIVGVRINAIRKLDNYVDQIFTVNKLWASDQFITFWNFWLSLPGWIYIKPIRYTT